MKCPYCGHRTEADFELCPVCSARFFSPPSRRNAPGGLGSSAALEVVFRASDPLEAQLIAGALADADMEYTLHTELADGAKVTPLEHAWSAGHQTLVSVPAVVAAEARELIRALESQPGEGFLVGSQSPSRRGMPRAVALVVLLIIGLPILAALVAFLAFLL
jgi:hypothetical protein